MASEVTLLGFHMGLCQRHANRLSKKIYMVGEFSFSSASLYSVVIFTMTISHEGSKYAGNLRILHKEGENHPYSGISTIFSARFPIWFSSYICSYRKSYPSHTENLLLLYSSHSSKDSGSATVFGINKNHMEMCHVVLLLYFNRWQAVLF